MPDKNDRDEEGNMKEDEKIIMAAAIMAE